MSAAAPVTPGEAAAAATGRPGFAAGLLRAVLAAGAALALAALLLTLIGVPALEAGRLMVQGSVGSPFALGETLARATPLVFTGLAVAVAFRARLWNIGAEGQLYAGALAAVALGSGAVVLDEVWLRPLVIFGAAAAGAALMLGPTFLRLRLGVDEVVTTLLLNFVVLLFVSMMLEGPLQDPMSMGWPQSPPVVEGAALPRLVERSRVHVGLLLGLILALALWVTLGRTPFGLRVRATGLNARAAAHAGVPTGKVLLAVGAISGGLAGLAGASEVLGLKGYLTQDLSPGFGYAGIVVATLARLHPLGVIAAAVFVAAVFVGADSMSRALDVSSYIANLIVASCLLGALVAGADFSVFKRRRGGKA